MVTLLAVGSIWHFCARIPFFLSLSRKHSLILVVRPQDLQVLALNCDKEILFDLIGSLARWMMGGLIYGLVNNARGLPTAFR